MGAERNAIEKPPYELRARFCGVLDWLCPWCGHLNRSRVERTSWKIQCTGKSCRRQFGTGLILHSLGTLQHAGRPILPPPDITFPVAELDLEYRSGAPLHRATHDPDAPAIEEFEEET